MVAKTWPKEPIVKQSTSISIVVEGFRCNELTLRVGNGKIERIAGCRFSYVADTTGFVTFEAFVSRRGFSKKVAETTIEVLPPPDDHAYIGERRGGSVQKEWLDAQAGITIRVYIGNGHAEALAVVTSYELHVYREGTLISKTSVAGNHFSPEVHAVIKSLQKGDVVLFANILGRTSMKDSVVLEPIQFEVSD